MQQQGARVDPATQEAKGGSHKCEASLGDLARAWIRIKNKRALVWQAWALGSQQKTSNAVLVGHVSSFIGGESKVFNKSMFHKIELATYLIHFKVHLIVL